MTTAKHFFRASAEDFKKIPGSPVAYWLEQTMLDAFDKYPTLYTIAPTKQGLATGDNDRFLRRWFEISIGRTTKGCASDSFEFALRKWFLCNKGGEFRKWFGNCDYVVNWEDHGREIKSFVDERGKLRSRPQNEMWYFKEGLTWSAISSGNFAMRYSPAGVMFETKGAMCFPRGGVMMSALGFLNSYVVRELLLAMAPTLDFHEGPVGRLPCHIEVGETKIAEMCVEKAKMDWNSYETSWDFAANPLVAELNNPVNPVEGKGMEAGGHTERVTLPLRSVSEASDKSAFQLSSLYAAVRARWAKSCEQMRRLETENNRIFIEAYGLQDELTPEVPWHEITLTCNPWYRYGVKEVEKVGGGGDSFPLNPELEARLKADTVKELISYAVGCMMGRYAIDKPGLILADQGSTYGDYLAKVSEPEFDPDEDGIIPVIDEDCFADDIVIQFHKFLRTAFGAANFNANLSFIEEAIGKDLRSYFTKDFYADHLQRYQKRPIYWLFSSPKGTFSALVYLHRYHPGTVGQVLTYLRSHITNLKSRLDAADRTTADPAATQGMKTKAIKERTKLMRQLKELEDYERDVLHPLASERLEIDLDDGVKANYPKFGKALRKIPGFE